MDGDHRLRPRRDRALQRRRIHRVVVRIDVDEYRLRARMLDRRDRCDEGERNGDDLVTRTNPRREQGHVQRARSRVHRDRVGDAAVRGELALETLHGRPQHELRVFEDTTNRSLDLRFQPTVLRLQIDERNHAVATCPVSIGRLPSRVSLRGLLGHVIVLASPGRAHVPCCPSPFALRGPASTGIPRGRTSAATCPCSTT